MKSYANLTKAFGIESNEAGRIALGLAPLYFVRSGLYRYGNGNINDLGSDGYCWSSTASDTTGAYYLRFGGSSVYPQRNSDRGLGLSLRCVAR